MPLSPLIRLADVAAEAGGRDCQPGGGKGLFAEMRRYLIVDNFPTAVPAPDLWLQCLTRRFLEYSQHRDFVAVPARAWHPRDTPKVERSVSCVRERLFNGSDFHSLTHLRNETRRWCLEVAGQQVHGTNRKQPLVVFQDEERHALLPGDGDPYEITHTPTTSSRPWLKPGWITRWTAPSGPS